MRKDVKNFFIITFVKIVGRFLSKGLRKRQDLRFRDSKFLLCRNLEIV